MDSTWTDYGIVVIVVGLVADAIRRYVFERRRFQAQATQAEADASFASQTTELRVDAAALAHAEAQLDFTTKAFDAERSSLNVRLDSQARQISELHEELARKDRELERLRQQVEHMQNQLAAMSETIDRLRSE